MAYKVKNTENVTVNGQFTVLSGTPGQRKVLTSDTEGNAAWADSTLGVAVGGSNTQVQFNLDGNLAGSDKFAWDNPTSSFRLGTRNGVLGNNSFTSGTDVTASGNNSTGIGNYVEALTQGSFAGGNGTLLNPIVSSGANSFVFSENTDDAGTSGYGAYGNNTAILGGRNHTIPTTSANSVAIGGDGIIVPDSTPDTVYVSNLAIYESPGVDSGSLNALVYDPATGEVLQRSISTTAGETNSAANLGGGSGIFAQKNGVNLELKSLVGSGGVSLVSSATEITITGNDYTAGEGIDLTANIITADLSAYSTAAGISLTSTAGDIDLTTTKSLGEANISVPANGIIDISVPSAFSINMDPNVGLVVTDSRTNGQGMEYGAHYWIDYSEYSLTDAGYVAQEITNAISGLSIPNDITASSGVQRVGDDIRLGGNNLSANTDINGATNTHSFSFSALNTFSVAGTGDISLTNTNVDLTLGSTLEIDDLRGVKNGLIYGTGSYTFIGKSLVDKNYVDGEITSIVPAGTGQVIFNNSGALNVNSNFIYNTAQNALIIGSNAAGTPGSSSLAVGSTTVSGDGSAAIGINAEASPPSGAAFAFGTFTKATGHSSLAGGRGNSVAKAIIASGSSAFNWSENTSGQTDGNGAQGNNTAILGGTDHNIGATIVRSVILGGNAINATVSDTAYVPNLRFGTDPPTSALGSPNSLVYNPTTKQVEQKQITFTELGLVGTKSVNEAGVADGKMLQYDNATDKLIYVTFTGANNTVLHREERTGNNSTTTYTMANTVDIVNYVEVNGLIQDLGDDYTISGDQIIFTSAPAAGFGITISYFEAVGVVIPPTSGEANDGANVGSGTAIFRDKIGTILNYKRVNGGTNISISDNGDDITINSTAPGPITYSAGNGISLSSTTFSVAAGTGLSQQTSGLALSHLGLQNLTSPGADRIMFWDQSGSALQWLSLGSNLSFSGTTLSASNTQLSNENVQDIVGAMVTGNTETDITVTYQDSDGTLDFAVDNVFVRKDTNTQSYSFNSGALVWNYTDSGNVDHINYNDTTNTYHMVADAALNASGNANVRCGTLYATGEVTAYSDSRLKENIRDIENSLDIVTKLKGVRYTRSEDKAERVGVIAQDVKKVLPEVVIEPQEPTDFYSVDYGKINAVLIEAVKELKNENDNLKAEIAEIKEMVKNIK